MSVRWEQCVIRLIEGFIFCFHWILIEKRIASCILIAVLVGAMGWREVDELEQWLQKRQLEAKRVFAQHRVLASTTI